MFWQEADIMGGDHGGGENETLQTDILRFLAIIGFCLMAVFALVQAIPVTGAKQSTVIEDLEHDARAQARELGYLRSENIRLNKELNRLMEHEGIARSREKELDRAKKELSRQKEQINRLIESKITQSNGLIEYKRLLSKREREIKALTRAKELVEMNMREAVRKISDLTTKKMAAGPIQTPPAGQKGLYVAFQSDQVFLDLLRADRISLFINLLGMKPGFRVITKGNRIDFVSERAEMGLDLWELKENLVPAEILEAFKSWTTLSSREKILTVGLTPEISRQIRGRKVSTGRFIIREGGAVSYSPEL
ncbi:MAG: hypothetical protein H8E10_17895 [Desulfobacterales bacterium]|nr:hypothetical protein [Desulfobacterales bacterium]